jgi:hypothetical protein
MSFASAQESILHARKVTVRFLSGLAWTLKMRYHVVLTTERSVLDEYPGDGHFA